MRWLTKSSLRFRSLFRRNIADGELDSELRFHIEKQIAANIASGLTPVAARRQAMLEFGGVEELKEECRDMRRINWLQDFAQDVRFGLRMLRKSPGFTVVAVLTLALGIGANTAIFSVVNSVLLRPLPYANANHLAMIFLDNPSLGIAHGNLGNADFLALRQQQQSFTGVAALRAPDNGFTLTGAGEAVEIPGASVTSDFFTVLGEKPMLGRTFAPNESDPGQPETVVVGYQFWKQYLGGDPAAVGRSITLDQKPYSVIGVMPPGFRFGQFGDAELWPILQIADIHQRPPYSLLVMGNLKRGVSLSSASADETRIADQVAKQYPSSEKAYGTVVPMKDFLVGNSSSALFILLGAVSLVLLIAIVNVASLQIARATSRQREMAIRVALGAGRYRLARQLLTESVLLGAIGGALGLALAYYGLSAIVALSPQFLPRMNEVTVDSRVLIFTVAVALLASIAFGLAPLLAIRSPQVNDSFAAGGRSVSGTAYSRWIHNLLVVSEFSFALVLLVGAGLLLRSFLRLEAVSPGFQPNHIVTAQLNLPPARYAKAAQVTNFYQQLLDKLGNVPGVEAAGLTMSLPPNLLEIMNPFHLEGQPYTGDKATSLAEEIPISENYFRALGVPLIAGRFFEEQDRVPGHNVLIINRSMAQLYFAGREAVGQRVQTGDANPKSAWYTIVGVVGDVKYEGLAAKPQPTMYVPNYDDGWNPWFTRSMSLVVRSRDNPGQIASALRSTVASLDRDIPLSRILAMDDLISESVGVPRFWTVLLSLFAALAVILAAVGIYGVMSFTVTRRTRDIGVMMALGAQSRDVLRRILGQGARLALLGTAIGLVAAFAVTRLMSSLLFGVSSTDPVTFLGVTLLLILVSLAACYIPARRAMKVDPMIALRYE